MFPSLAARKTYVAETNFAARKQENVFASDQKHVCFTDTKFASETYVTQLSQHENNVDQFPVLLIKNVSQQRSQFLIIRMRDSLFS